MIWLQNNMSIYYISIRSFSVSNHSSYVNKLQWECSNLRGMGWIVRLQGFIYAPFVFVMQNNVVER